VAALAIVVAAGCESTSSTPARPVYTAGQTGTMITQEKGLVVAVEEVLIKAPSSSSNTGTGAQMGRAVGSAILNPGAIVGSMGSIMGAKAGASLDNQVGDKITIVTDEGRTVTIVQPREPNTAPIMPNERVVIEVGGAASRLGSGTTRVVRDTSGPDDSQIVGALPAAPTTPKRVW
jgi:outer membrane lipoprotein SlyB